MTSRQKKFAEYYAQCGNTVQSAIKAGYSETYANKLAHKLLENIGVAAYIKELSEEVEAHDNCIMTVKERHAILSEIARDKDNSPTDRNRAIETINKMTGEYTVKVDTTVRTSEKFSDILDQLGGEGLAE